MQQVTPEPFFLMVVNNSFGSLPAANHHHWHNNSFGSLPATNLHHWHALLLFSGFSGGVVATPNAQ